MSLVNHLWAYGITLNVDGMTSHNRVWLRDIGASFVDKALAIYPIKGYLWNK